MAQSTNKSAVSSCQRAATRSPAPAPAQSPPRSASHRWSCQQPPDRDLKDPGPRCANASSFSIRPKSAATRRSRWASTRLPGGDRGLSAAVYIEYSFCTAVNGRRPQDKAVRCVYDLPGWEIRAADICTRVPTPRACAQGTRRLICEVRLEPLAEERKRIVDGLEEAGAPVEFLEELRVKLMSGAENLLRLRPDALGHLSQACMVEPEEIDGLTPRIFGGSSSRMPVGPNAARIQSCELGQVDSGCGSPWRTSSARHRCCRMAPR